jgi:flagellar biosynthesis/type III secretory pathway protein FliH
MSFFNRDFDAEIAAEKKQQEQSSLNPSVPSPEEIAKLTGDARLQGFEAGRSEGYESAQQDAKISLAAQRTDAISNLRVSLAELTESHIVHMSSIEESMAGVLADVCEKIFPAIIKDQENTEILAEINRVVKQLSGSQWLEIHVPSEVLEALEDEISEISKQFENSIEIRVFANPELSGTTVKSFWQNGRSEYNLNRLCQKIIDTISNK